jgi:hypothetical protein
MKPFDFIGLVFLESVPSILEMPDWADKISTVAVMAIGLYYFAKNERESKAALEAIRKENERQISELQKEYKDVVLNKVSVELAEIKRLLLEKHG